MAQALVLFVVTVAYVQYAASHPSYALWLIAAGHGVLCGLEFWSRVRARRQPPVPTTPGA